MSSSVYRGIITHAALAVTIALASALSLGCGSQPNDAPADCRNRDKGPNGCPCTCKSKANGLLPDAPPNLAASLMSGVAGNMPISPAMRDSLSPYRETRSANHMDISPESLFEKAGWDASFYAGNVMRAGMRAATVGGGVGGEADAAKRMINLSRTDFAMLGSGGSRIVLSRDYNNLTSNYQSNLDGTTCLGPNWHLYYDMYVSVVPDDQKSFVRTKGGGMTVLYPRGNGVWVSTPATGEALRLERIGGEYKLTSVNPEVYHMFGPGGGLKYIRYRGGNLVRVDRNADGSIYRIRFDHETNNTDNRYLEFEYSSVAYNRVTELFYGCDGGQSQQVQTIDHTKSRTRLSRVRLYPGGAIVAQYDYGTHAGSSTIYTGCSQYSGTGSLPAGDDSGMLTAVQNGQGQMIEAYDNHRLGAGQLDDPWTLVGLRQRASDGSMQLTRTYDVDEDGHLWRIKDGGGNLIAQFSEDALHSSTATMGDGTVYTYDSNHARDPIHTEVTAANGTVLETSDQKFDVDAGWTNNATSLLKTYSRDSGDTVTYTYVDSSLTSWTTATVDEYYSPRRTLVSQISYADGRFTSYDYDQNNRITTVTEPLQRVTAYAYDSEGNVISSTDPEGHTSSFEYDDHGRMKKRFLPSGLSEEFAYGPYGELRQTTSTEGRSALYKTDATGRLTTVTTEDESFALTYDVQDRLTTVTTSTGLAYGIEYVGTSNRAAKLIDALGRSTTPQYNDRGLVSQVTDSAGRLVKYDYDSNDRLTTVTDQRNNVFARVFDEWGRLIMTRNALGKETHLTYYGGAGCAPCGASNGKLAAIVKPDGSSEEYTYENNRLKSVQYSSGAQVHLTYDTAGRVTSVQDNRIPYEYAQGNCTFQYAYDMNDRLTTTTYPDGANVIYAYDSAGRRIRMTDPDGNVTQYQYGTGTNSAKVTSIQHPLSGQTIFNYFANGQLESEYRVGNGGVETWEYDTLKRPKTHTSYDGGGGRINQETYTYNAAWMRTRVDRVSDTGLVPSSTSKLYGYDSSDRFVSEQEVNNLTSATIYQQAFNYDDAGNRTAWNDGGTTMPFEFNAMNQMTNGGGLECGFDENGSLMYRTDDILNPSFLQWFYNDNSGRLIAFEDLFVGTYLNFGYDTAGRMIWRTTSDGKMLKYYYDGNNVVLVKEAPGRENPSYSTKIVYTLAPRNINQIIAESRTAYPSDWTGAGLTRWYHYDFAGSVVSLSDEDAVPVVQYDQDAYGLVRNRSVGGSNLRHLAGAEYDPDMGLYHSGRRWFDPYTAQWADGGHVPGNALGLTINIGGSLQGTVLGVDVMISVGVVVDGQGSVGVYGGVNGGVGAGGKVSAGVDFGGGNYDTIQDWGNEGGYVTAGGGAGVVGTVTSTYNSSGQGVNVNVGVGGGGASGVGGGYTPVCDITEAAAKPVEVFTDWYYGVTPKKTPECPPTEESPGSGDSPYGFPLGMPG